MNLASMRLLYAILVANLIAGCSSPALQLNKTSTEHFVFAPNGKTVAIACLEAGDGETSGYVLLWNIERKEGHTILKKKGVLDSVLFSPDGKRLAIGWLDGSVHLWNIEENREEISLSYQRAKSKFSTISCMDFSPDGCILAIGISPSVGKVDQTLFLWDRRAKDTLPPLPESPEMPTHGVKFSSDGNLFASGSTDKVVKVWDMKTKTLKFALKGYTPTVGNSSIVFLSREKVLVTLAKKAPDFIDTEIIIWDLMTGKLKKQWVADRGRICSLAVSPDGALLVSGGMDDKKVKVWNLAKGQEIHSIAHKGVINSVAYSPSGHIIASLCDNGLFRIFDGNTFQELESETLLPPTLNK